MRERKYETSETLEHTWRDRWKTTEMLRYETQIVCRDRKKSLSPGERDFVAFLHDVLVGMFRQRPH